MSVLCQLSPKWFTCQEGSIFFHGVILVRSGFRQQLGQARVLAVYASVFRRQ
jgi:hypothetical protein